MRTRLSSHLQEFCVLTKADFSVIKAPIKVFDDGEFTYLQFRDTNAELPAIFSVDEDLKESMVNYRLQDGKQNMIVVERVFHKLSVRLGKKVVCVFNQMYHPY